MQLEDKVLNTIKKYKLIEDGDKIVIGVSGGPDSMTLLNVLYRVREALKIEIYVAHINHMIRTEADDETRYVQEFCQKLNIPIYIKRTDVLEEAKKQKIGTELAGRNIRYKFFEEVCKKVNANKIATAHNANDNAETVLMNIMRGTGLSGLRGIEKIRDGRFIRPIIECTRSEIEAYCVQNAIEPKYDKTNKENVYTRNKIRNLLIPYIEEKFNPNIIECLNRLSTIAANDEDYFGEIVESEYEKLKITVDNLKDNTIILDLRKFNDLDTVIKTRLILYTITKLLGTSQGIEKIHIDDIIKLCSNNIGNKFLIPHKGLKIFVKKGRLYFIKLLEN